MSYIQSALHSRVSPASTSDLSPVDENLNAHVHGCLFPFHTDTWAPTHTSSTYPSRKIKSFARATFKTGALDGFGYVQASPSCASNATISVRGSDGVAATAYNSFANGTSHGTNSPYIIADFNSTSYLARNNVCGLRCRNITPLMDRGGTLYALRSPNDAPLAGTFNTLISRGDVTGDSMRCDTTGGKWNYVYWVPRDDDSSEYAPDYRTVGPNLGYLDTVIAFVAEQPSGIQQTYEFEYVCWSEVIGASGVVPVQGCTPNDPHIHTQKVHQIVSKLQSRPEVAQNEPSHYLSQFITRAVLEGHRIADIVKKGCDIASRTASVTKDVMNVGRMILTSV